MTLFEMIISSIALASDAFSVSICIGLSLFKIKILDCIKVSIWFGLFQALMPFIGHFIGVRYENTIIHFDHYIAFILLLYIGIKLIKDSFNNNDINNNINIKNMLILSIATSIDAFAFGIAYACAYKNNKYDIVFIIIGIITFLFCFLGVYIGNRIGDKFNKISKVLGGIILILISFKILLEHLNVI